MCRTLSLQNRDSLSREVTILLSPLAGPPTHKKLDDFHSLLLNYDINAGEMVLANKHHLFEDMLGNEEAPDIYGRLTTLPTGKTRINKAALNQYAFVTHSALFQRLTIDPLTKESNPEISLSTLFGKLPGRGMIVIAPSRRGTPDYREKLHLYCHQLYKASHTQISGLIEDLVENLCNLYGIQDDSYLFFHPIFRCRAVSKSIPLEYLTQGSFVIHDITPATAVFLCHLCSDFLQNLARSVFESKWEETAHRGGLLFLQTRGISHDLYSHAIQAELMEYRMLTNKRRYEAKTRKEIRNVTAEILRESRHLCSLHDYVKSRLVYVNDSYSEATWRANVNLRDAFDMLTMHGDDVLDNIIRDDLFPGDISKPIYNWSFRTEINGRTLAQSEVRLPSGLVGAHGLCCIIENIARNATKHAREDSLNAVKSEDSAVRLRVSVVENFENRDWNQDFVGVTLSMNLAHAETYNILEKRFSNARLIDSDGALQSEDWGLLEIALNAAHLRGIAPHRVRRILDERLNSEGRTEPPLIMLRSWLDSESGEWWLEYTIALQKAYNGLYICFPHFECPPCCLQVDTCKEADGVLPFSGDYVIVNSACKDGWKELCKTKRSLLPSLCIDSNYPITDTLAIWRGLCENIQAREIHFIQAWGLYQALQNQHFPGINLVFHEAAPQELPEGAIVVDHRISDSPLESGYDAVAYYEWLDGGSDFRKLESLAIPENLSTGAVEVFLRRLILAANTRVCILDERLFTYCVGVRARTRASGGKAPPLDSLLTGWRRQGVDIVLPQKDELWKALQKHDDTTIFSIHQKLVKQVLDSETENDPLLVELRSRPNVILHTEGHDHTLATRNGFRALTFSHLEPLIRVGTKCGLWTVLQSARGRMLEQGHSLTEGANETSNNRH